MHFLFWKKDKSEVDKILYYLSLLHSTINNINIIIIIAINKLWLLYSFNYSWICS